MKCGAVNLVRDANLAQHLPEGCKILSVPKQALDGHPDVVPPGDLPAMSMLMPWNDTEENALHPHSTNPECKGPLVRLLENDHEILRAVARRAHLVRWHANTASHDSAHISNGDVDMWRPTRATKSIALVRAWWPLPSYLVK